MAVGAEKVGEQGHPMGVLAEIAQRVLRTTERAFRIHHPRGAEQWTKPLRESLRSLKRGKCSVETKPVLGMQIPEAIHKLAPEYFFENTDGQEEPLLRVDPPGVVRSQTAGGNHTVDVRMMLELLVPGVQDAEETYLGAEAPRVACDLKQRLGAGPEQQRVDLAFVLQRQQ
jgi:hypothetical protein